MTRRRESAATGGAGVGGSSGHAGASVGDERAEVVSGATIGDSGGSQTLVLDGFPSPYMVARLGPNSGTINRYGLGRLRKDVQGMVKVAVTLQGIRPVPPPAAVTLRYVFGDARHRDPDNFAIIAKPCIDGLVRAGILAGDDGARLTQRVEFVKEPGSRRLEIIVTPAPDAGGGEG